MLSKTSKRIFLLAGFAIATGVIVCGVLFTKHATSTRIVASVDLPTGERVRVVQDFTGEPFNTAVYFDNGDGRWRWYYYDHEDWFWHTAETTVNNGFVTVAGGGRHIRVDTSTGSCTIQGSQVGERHYGISDRIVDISAILNSESG